MRFTLAHIAFRVKKLMVCVDVRCRPAGLMCYRIFCRSAFFTFGGACVQSRVLHLRARPMARLGGVVLSGKQYDTYGLVLLLRHISEVAVVLQAGLPCREDTYA